jgi:hypothetical protein
LAPPTAFWILPDGLRALAFHLGLRVARDLADDFLDGALDLVGDAGDAILVHLCTPVLTGGERKPPSLVQV